MTVASEASKSIYVRLGHRQVEVYHGSIELTSMDHDEFLMYVAEIQQESVTAPSQDYWWLEWDARKEDNATFVCIILQLASRVEGDLFPIIFVADMKRLCRDRNQSVEDIRESVSKGCPKVVIIGSY